LCWLINPRPPEQHIAGRLAGLAALDSQQDTGTAACLLQKIFILKEIVNLVFK
jgi:hypothetical protein